MENQGRSPEKQRNNEAITFVAFIGLLVTILLIIFKN